MALREGAREVHALLWRRWDRDPVAGGGALAWHGAGPYEEVTGGVFAARTPVVPGPSVGGMPEHHSIVLIPARVEEVVGRVRHKLHITDVC